MDVLARKDFAMSDKLRKIYIAYESLNMLFGLPYVLLQISHHGQ